MTVKRTKKADPELGDVVERVSVDLTKPDPADFGAIGEMLKAASPEGCIISLRKQFLALPDNLPERIEFDQFIAQKKAYTLDDADRCKSLLERAKRRQEKRSNTKQKSDAGEKSSRRLKHIYNLIKGWMERDPDLKTSDVLERLKDYHSEGFGDEVVEIFSDGDRVFQHDHKGTKVIPVRRAKEYAAEIRKKLKYPG